MEICTGAASSTLSDLSKWVCSKAASNINYLLCYDRKVQELKQLVRKLDIKKKDIQQEVDAATRNGRTIDADVSQWLTNLNVIDEDARRLEERVKGVRCFMRCCWNCFSSYKIGKEVAEKIDAANKLLSTNFTTYSHEPPPPSIESLYSNRDFQESLSTKSSKDNIWEALNNECFYIIGVYGMGGVGKTTIMKEVLKRAKNEGQYNEVIMVTVSQNQDVKRMQTEIAEKLGLQLTAKSESYRGGKILERIKGARKILIILDDLWDILDLSKIGIPSANENKECKVVITTRSREVCHDMECQQHIKVEPLSPKESWDLFKSKVGDVVEKADNLNKVAVDVAKECGGLPLAIITLGRAMRDKDDISTWISVRTELRQSIQTHIRGMENSVFKCIRRSFDYLRRDEAKLCFLLCSLFPEDWEIYIIEFFRYVVGEGILRHVYSMEDAWNNVRRLLDELKDCCLLVEGKDSEHFKMHDVVRDVAIWISSDKTYGFYGFANKGLRRWPQIGQVDECQRIYLMGNSYDSLPEQPVFPNLRTMILKETQISTIPDGFFQGMEALLVLDLKSKKVASLPSSFPCLVNLKALFLSRGDENFDVTSLSLIGELKNLEILQLQGFKFGTVPKEFGNLTSLRCLDLLRCRGTIPRNLISRLSRNLEQLYLTDVFMSNWQVEDEGSSSATFAELASLSCLTTLHVHIENPDVFLQQQDLNSVPWPELTDFKIAVGILPDSFGTSRSRSKDLSITKSTYKYKWVIDLVMKTERLCLHNWSGMECLIGGAEEGFTDDVGHKLFEVKELELESMPDMTSVCRGTLPNDILQKLERLVIRRCDKLEKVLSLNFVQEIEEEGQSAAAGIVLLPRLEYLTLIELPELRSVWGDDDSVIMLPAGSLQNLRSLEVKYCKSLKDDHILPPILPIPSLRELNISGCHSLTYLLSWRQAKGLPHLQTLQVGECERMKTVIKAAATDDDDDDENLLASAVQLLPQLDSIHLYRLPRLTNFCEYVEDFPSLRQLDISRCDSLTYLLSWRQAKGLPHLQYLTVRDCGRMETLIKAAATDDDDDDKSLASAVQLLPRLENIWLSGLPELRSVWGDDGVLMLPAGSLQNLQSLNVLYCKRLKDDHILPPILPIPSLRSLEISGCDSLTYLLSWRQAKGLPHLESLTVNDCDSLTYLLSWRQAKGLPHLESLTVSYCERMETVIKAATDEDKSLDSAVQLLPQLVRIELELLPMLTNFGEYLEADFPSLRELEIRGCDSLTYLLSWRQAKGLPHLQYLHVGECDRMETLIKAAATDHDDHKEEESHVLLSLTELDLRRLPRLRSFQGGEQCSKSVLSSFKSLKDLKVAKCPKLKKLPLSSSSHALESLRGVSWEWFESLEWGEDESIKERLRPLFQVWEWPYEEDESDEYESDEDEDESDEDESDLDDPTMYGSGQETRFATEEELEILSSEFS